MDRKLYSILLLIVLFTIGYGSVSAQREQTREVTVTGNYVSKGDESLTDAYAKALFDAKEEALVAAGVYESISSTAIVEIGGSGDNFKEINLELARIELEGRVLVKEKINQTMQPHNGLYEYSVTIRAEVKVEEAEEDLKFDFTTEGLHNTYFEGENMTFAITPTANCYLRIFYFDPSSNEQVYPIKKIYKDIQFKANESVSFPLPHDRKYLYDPYSVARDCTMELVDKNHNIEQGVLLVVALKDDYRFTGEVNYENVLHWLFRIKRNQKRVHWYGVNIAKR